MNVGFNGDIEWRDNYFTQEDLNPAAVQKAFARFNAGVRVYNEKYDLALIGRNLANERYVEMGVSKAFGSQAGFGDFTASTPPVPRSPHPGERPLLIQLLRTVVKPWSFAGLWLSTLGELI